MLWDRAGIKESTRLWQVLTRVPLSLYRYLLDVLRPFQPILILITSNTDALSHLVVTHTAPQGILESLLSTNFTIDPSVVVLDAQNNCFDHPTHSHPSDTQSLPARKTFLICGQCWNSLSLVRLRDQNYLVRFKHQGLENIIHFWFLDGHKPWSLGWNPSTPPSSILWTCVALYTSSPCSEHLILPPVGYSGVESVVCLIQMLRNTLYVSMRRWGVWQSVGVWWSGSESDLSSHNHGLIIFPFGK